jgi:hypothetical protein
MSNVLNAGERLDVGELLEDPTGRYRLVMQADGNLVLYTHHNTVLWHANTDGTGANRAVMQHDGNFVVYDSDDRPHFNTRTHRHPGSRLVLQADSNLVVYDSSQKPRWHIHSVIPGWAPISGDVISAPVSSPNGLYRLIPQGDGNLVLRLGNRAMWHSRTHGHPGAQAAISDRGQIVFSRNGSTIKTLGDRRERGTYALVVHNDGSVVVRTPQRVNVWTSESNHIRRAFMLLEQLPPGVREQLESQNRDRINALRQELADALGREQWNQFQAECGKYLAVGTALGGRVGAMVGLAIGVAFDKSCRESTVELMLGEPDRNIESSPGNGGDGGGGGDDEMPLGDPRSWHTEVQEYDRVINDHEESMVA